MAYRAALKAAQRRTVSPWPSDPRDVRILLVLPDDVEMLQDLVMAAVNEGMEKAQEMAQSKMGALTGGLNIPGLT